MTRRRGIPSREDRENEARLRGLRNLARKVFVDRNAEGFNRPGMPKGDRLLVRAAMRPHLRECIKWLRRSRDALAAGNVEMHELLRDRARMYRAFAVLEIFQPGANKYGDKLVAFAAQSSAGGKAKAAARPENIDLAELDDLIRGCLQRREAMRVKVWQEEYSLSKTAIYERIKRIRGE